MFVALHIDVKFFGVFAEIVRRVVCWRVKVCRHAITLLPCFDLRNTTLSHFLTRNMAFPFNVRSDDSGDSGDEMPNGFSQCPDYGGIYLTQHSEASLESDEDDKKESFGSPSKKREYPDDVASRSLDLTQGSETSSESDQDKRKQSSRSRSMKREFPDDVASLRSNLFSQHPDDVASLQSNQPPDNVASLHSNRLNGVSSSCVNTANNGCAEKSNTSDSSRSTKATTSVKFSDDTAGHFMGKANEELYDKIAKSIVDSAEDKFYEKVAKSIVDNADDKFYEKVACNLVENSSKVAFKQATEAIQKKPKTDALEAHKTKH